MKLKIAGPELPQIPWEERPAGSSDVLWRYSKNPVIPRDLIPCANSIFNSAVVPYKGEFRECSGWITRPGRCGSMLGGAKMASAGSWTWNPSGSSATMRKSPGSSTVTIPG